MILSLLLKQFKPAAFLLLPASLALLFLGSCASTDYTADGEPRVSVYEKPIDFTKDGYSVYLRTAPEGGNPVFFASVQRMADREKEAAAALSAAAAQASRFFSVKTVSRLYTVKLNSSSRHLRDLDVSWDKELAARLTDRLAVTGISRDTYGTYLTAVLPDTPGPAVSAIRAGSSGGKPSWVSSIPEIPGYRSAVGIALQTGYIADSFNAADNQALEDLARQESVSIVTDKKTIQNSVGTASLQSNYEESEVTIAGFYILERWRSPDGRYYYSLAIAPEPER